MKKEGSNLKKNRTSLATLLVLILVISTMLMPFSSEVLEVAHAHINVEDIALVCVVDEDGVATRIGEKVVVEGVITVSTGLIHTSNTIVYVQDETGGIGIFASGVDQDLAEGDKVRITALVGQWRGLVQLQEPVFEILAQNVALPVAKEIEIDKLAGFDTAEALEGMLVRTYVRISEIPSSAAGGAFNVRITDVDGNNRSTLRIGEGTDINVSAMSIGEEYTVVGIVGQFDSSSPFHSGYQLFPRSMADLVLEKEAPPTPEDTVFPTRNAIADIGDGDSITLKTPVIVNGVAVTEVRLLGIDTPEVFTRGGKDPGNQITFGEAATRHLESVMPVGSEVIIVVDEVKLGNRGRLLAYVIKDGMNINEEMLRSGNAVTYVVSPNSMNDRRFNSMRNAMKKAMENNRGIWNEGSPIAEIPLKYRERMFGSAAEEFIGDFNTRKYVPFSRMEEVAIEDRVIFFSLADAINANFASKDWQTSQTNVIFIHPDGAAANHFEAARLLTQGAGGMLHHDRLNNIALYRAEILDSLQAGSVGGAVAHATGVNTLFNFYGLDKEGNKLTTITEEARDAGFATGLINSGTITEPGTGVFVAGVSSRRDNTGIALQIMNSGVDVILGGGEQWFLPEGTMGVHGEGRRTDGLNLIEQAREMGYTVVFTRDELLSLDVNETDKLLGLFAAHHTFNAKTEEYLKENNLPEYWDYSPTLAEMTNFAIAVLSKTDKGFFLVIEEEGTDNFADGANNAQATMNAIIRADEAIGLAVNFAKIAPETLVITAADSDAGGLSILAPGPSRIDGWEGKVPDTAGSATWHAPYQNMAAADGVGGTGGAPFETPDGKHKFGITWAGQSDFANVMIARAYGNKAELVDGTIDNTDIHKIMMIALGLKECDGSLVADEVETGVKEGQRNVIFIHPDGASANHFEAARLLTQGAGGMLNHDKLFNIALYRAEILDSLQAGSVGGAVAHATGVNTLFNFYGLDKDGNKLTTITEVARDAGFATGLINSGTITEPGTGVFVAGVSSRRDNTGIALQIMNSGVDVILGGGEQWFLPEGTMGVHGEGRRTDGLNLIEQAREMGYTVVFTRDELLGLNISETDKLLGLFAAHHTFNDKTEEFLKENNLPEYWDYTPTLAEMTDFAIAILSKTDKGFFLVVEEEGTDNFADGANNAQATMNAIVRADEAIGVAVDFAKEVARTLVITSADSDGGGLSILAPGPSRIDGWEGKVPDTAGSATWHAPYQNMAAADGVGGTGGAPFETPDGKHKFGIAWAGQSDFANVMIARAYGYKSELVTGTIDNTDIHKIMMTALGLEKCDKVVEVDVEEVKEEEVVVEADKTEIYIVKEGDMLWKIAEKFNTTWEILQELNKLEDPGMIYVGQKLIVTAK